MFISSFFHIDIFEIDKEKVKCGCFLFSSILLKYPHQRHPEALMFHVMNFRHFHIFFCPALIVDVEKLIWSLDNYNYIICWIHFYWRCARRFRNALLPSWGWKNGSSCGQRYWIYWCFIWPLLAQWGIFIEYFFYVSVKCFHFFSLTMRMIL